MNKQYNDFIRLYALAFAGIGSLYPLLGQYLTSIGFSGVEIAVSGGPKKDFLDKRISKDLEKVIQDKTSRLIHEKESIVEVINEKDSLNEYSSQVLVPILSQGDAIGAFIILSKDEENPLMDMQLKAAEIGASFLARQMES